MGDEGLEPTPKSSGKTALSKIGGTESGTVQIATTSPDKRLRGIIEKWPRLSESAKEAVWKLVSTF
jgi:hypothetical protein